jgi:hypothetical protein
MTTGLIGARPVQEDSGREIGEALHELPASLVFLLYQKGRDSRIFQAQDRAMDDFTLEGKTKERQY